MAHEVGFQSKKSNKLRSTSFVAKTSVIQGLFILECLSLKVIVSLKVKLFERMNEPFLKSG